MSVSANSSILKRIDTPSGYIADGRMHYYVKDYQGNVRQVTDADGKVEQDNHYYPYGMLMAESSDIIASASGTATTTNSLNPYLYGGKEYLTTGSANLLDFTARTYDPTTLLFHTQDPKATDYTPFLPYLYCGSDPINKIDRNGMEIEFADSVSTEFKDNFWCAVNYLRLHQASEQIDKIINSKDIYILTAPSQSQIAFVGDEQNLSGCNTYKDGSVAIVKILIWDYHTVIETTMGYILSPAEILSHEADHISQIEIDYDVFFKNLKTIDDEYGNLEEKRVITGSEQNVAKKLGRLPNDSVTRNNHGQRMCHKANGIKGLYIEKEGATVYGKRKN